MVLSDKAMGHRRFVRSPPLYRCTTPPVVPRTRVELPLFLLEEVAGRITPSAALGSQRGGGAERTAMRQKQDDKGGSKHQRH